MRRDTVVLPKATDKKAVGYSDSVDSIQTDLAKLYDNDSTSNISYATVRDQVYTVDDYIQILQPNSIVYDAIVLDANGGGDVSATFTYYGINVYFGVSMDNKSYRWFGGSPLIEYASQTLAKQNALRSTTREAILFPAGIVGNYMRMYITDDMDAIETDESITFDDNDYTNYVYELFFDKGNKPGTLISANTIEADRMNVNTLSAITADVGLLEAGIIQSTNFDDGGAKFDLDNDRLDVYDSLGVLRVRLGKLT